MWSFVACDYLGGGDGSRPDDGDFIGLEVQADAAQACSRASVTARSGKLADALPPVAGPDDRRHRAVPRRLRHDDPAGKYADYPAIGIFGASPRLIANTREQPGGSGVRRRRRAWITAENARQSGGTELPMYHGAPREQFRGIFHVVDVPDDLLAYDEAECHTPSPQRRDRRHDPGFAQPFADRIRSPVFLAFGEFDVSPGPARRAEGYPRSSDITVFVCPRMSHMHNFARPASSSGTASTRGAP